MTTTQNTLRLADELTYAREIGDANHAAQALLQTDDRAHLKQLSDMGLNYREPERTGFWADVETLLRLETAPDETPEQAEERWHSEGALPCEARSFWMGAANVLGHLDAHVRDYLAQDLRATGTMMAMSAWEQRELAKAMQHPSGQYGW